MTDRVATDLRRVLDAAKKGPRSIAELRQRAQLLYEEDIPIDEAMILDAIRSESDGGPSRAVMRQWLAQWDFAAEGDWTKGTSPNTRSRRDAIYDAMALDTAARLVLDEFLPFFEVEPITVIAAERWERWYTPERRASRDFYWRAFSDYLRASRSWSEESILSLDQTTTAVVERLADPTQSTAYQAKGLVVGYVQSGKTANITGVVAKAADAGYRLIIVLAGTQNMLRDQTQRRLDRELLGAELLEDEYLDDAEWDDFLRHGARPSILGSFDWIRLTTRAHDYRKLHGGAIESLRFRKRDPQRPFNDPANLHPSDARLVVAKKNATVLAKLARDLERANAGGELAEVPTIIIDDESDQASVNTIRPPADPEAETERTRINQSIVDLIGALPRSQYVGYTATPFANVFIDPGNAEDLFPRDFIVSLPRPPGYLGVRDFHDLDGRPAGVLADAYESNERAFVRPVYGEDGTHEELRRAIDSFVLSGALKLYREAQTDFRFEHHTMIVHTSHLTADHRQQVDRVRGMLSDGGYLTGECLPRLRDLLDSDFRPVSLSRHPELPFPRRLSDLDSEIGETISRLYRGANPVLLVNSNADADQLAFDAEAVWKIVVGGAKLSRGFTVEGLTVSFFGRKSPTADTLMQMGRWCGFRRGYDDLVRLYIARAAGADGDFDVYETYEAICRDEESFREELQRYATPSEDGEPITPRDVPPLVASHLDWVKPTSRNKMYNATIGFRNFGGRVSEHRLAPVADDDIVFNERLFSELLGSLDLARTELRADAVATDAIVGIAEPDWVVSLLDRYRWLDQRPLLAPELEFLRGQHGDPEVDDWAIVAPQLQRGSAGVAWRIQELEFSVHLRKRAPGTHLVNAYAGPDDRAIASLIAGIAPERVRSTNQALTDLMSPHRAVMLLYPITHRSSPGKDWHPTMGFTLVFPPNRIKRLIGFVVRNPDQPYEPIVSA